MADGRKKQQQRRRAKKRAGSAGWMKYAFVVMDAVIIIGAVYLISSAIRPVKAPEDTAGIEADTELVILDPDGEETELPLPDEASMEIQTEDPEDGSFTAETDLSTDPEMDDAGAGAEDAPDENASGEAGDEAADEAAVSVDTADDGTPGEGTAAPEPAVTEAPVTEPPAPETPATEPPAPVPPVTAMPYVGNIHPLSQDQINAIRANYDCNARGYGGITFFQSAASIQSQMDSMGINCRTLVPGGNTVALTFQEGWEPGYTGQLLDILAQKGVKGNFYITHEYAASRPDLVWRMINEGHTVGSHTYVCPDPPIAHFNLEDIMNDAMQMQQYMHDAFGYDMHAYNYNSGIWSPGSAKLLSDMGYTVVLCSNSYSDFDAYSYIDPNVWLPQLQAGLVPGSIYAFHVTNPVTVQMIGPLIDYIRAMGYTFVLI